MAEKRMFLVIIEDDGGLERVAEYDTLEEAQEGAMDAYREYDDPSDVKITVANGIGHIVAGEPAFELFEV